MSIGLRVLCTLVALVLGTSWFVVGCEPPKITEPSVESIREAVADAASSEPLPEQRKTEPQQPETKVETNTPDVPSCTLASTQTTYSVAQGRRLVLSTETLPAGGTVKVFRRPVGWVELPSKEPNRLVLRTDYSPETKQTVVLLVSCGNDTSKVSIDIEVKPVVWSSVPSWKPGDTGPLEREHPRVWWDASSPDTLWLWGGLVFVPKQFTPSYDLWKLDVPSGKWTKVAWEKDGLALTTAHVAPIPGGQKVLVYGGEGPDNRQSSGDVYEIDTSKEKATWTKREKDKWLPGATTLGSLVYDAPRKRYLSVCGFQQEKFGYDIHCRISVYTPDAPEGQRWKQAAIDGTGPDGRYGFAYVHDKARERLLVFSGGRAPVASSDPVNAAQDAWWLDLTSQPMKWTRLAPSGVKVKGRRNGCFALDPEGKRLFLFGGTADARTAVPGLFALHLDDGAERWHQVQVTGEPVIRASCIGTYDEKRKQVLFGFGNAAGIYADFHGVQLAPK